MRPGRVIAHRGGASLAPENTRAAVAASAAVGARWVEVDVRLLGDGTPVLFHDRELDRCTDLRGPLSALNADMIEGVDAGGWFSPRFRGEPIPRLDAVLADCARFGLGVNLELKREPGEPQDRVVRAVAGVLAASGGGRTDVLLSSFDEAVVAACRDLAPAWARATIQRRLPRDIGLRCQRYGAAAVVCDWRRLTGAGAARVKDHGLLLYCYTINNPAAFRHRWGWGVDGVITDRPQDFLAWRG
ncbi:glycerophosphodiester phosphodiesterase family protein [Arhodomonas sp. SL1]|uniref:glycerophosphodiester phosphodiesterase family protein n=1 Tax=Arhodomonas sp. SL1 TaxID=3425691 RepID=UPI003F885C07